MSDLAAADAADVDPQETAEWREALEGVIAAEGPARAQDLLARVLAGAARRGVPMTAGLSTPYLNTLSPAADAAVIEQADSRRARRPAARPALSANRTCTDGVT